jgi:hypothetical protein
MASETGPDPRAAEAAATFWRWFVRHERRLRQAPIDVVTDEIFERVCGYCSARGLPSDLLGIEVAREEGRPPELVVTAYGMEEDFPVADALVAAAPALLGWKLFALKPPLGFDVVHDSPAVGKVDSALLRFDPLSNRDPLRVWIRVHVPGYEPERKSDWVVAVHNLLMTGLGEREFGRMVEAFTLAPLPEGREADELLRLEELPAYVAWHRRRHAKPEPP